MEGLINRNTLSRSDCQGRRGAPLLYINIPGKGETLVWNHSPPEPIHPMRRPWSPSDGRVQIESAGVRKDQAVGSP